MKRLILGLIGASVLAGTAPAMAQPWGSDRDDHWRDHHRYDRDRDDWRWRHHRRFREFGFNERVCAWRYGERVCWIQNN